MTAAARTRFTCDRRGPYCVVTAEFDGGLRDARVLARVAGWRRWQHPALDLCPSCQLTEETR